MFSPIYTMFTYFPFRAWSTVLILAAVSRFAYQRIRRSWETGRLTKLQGGAQWLLVSYILLLFFLTVLGRRSQDFYRYNFDVGYSFRDAYYNGTPDTIRMILVNIAMFVPVGFLGTLGARRFGFLKATALGVMLTSLIELSQLLLRNGTCEIDDLISNTAGALTGIVLAVIFRRMIRNLPKKAAVSALSVPKSAASEEAGWVTFEIELLDPSSAS